MTIGEVARRAGVATSTVRYYERRGLLAGRRRRSGQRRYREETLRRLVFIGMLQDAGLALDDIDGILGAADVARVEGDRRAAARRARRGDRAPRAGPDLPRGRPAVPLRPPGDRLQDHGRRDRPPPRPVRRCRLVTDESLSLEVEHDGLVVARCLRCPGCSNFNALDDAVRRARSQAAVDDLADRPDVACDRAARCRGRALRRGRRSQGQCVPAARGRLGGRAATAPARGNGCSSSSTSCARGDGRRVARSRDRRRRSWPRPATSASPRPTRSCASPSLRSVSR